jgi:hypothetical protein
VRELEVGIRGPSSEVKGRVYGHLEQMEQHLRAVRRAEKRTDTKHKLLALENGLNTENSVHSEVSASASGIFVWFLFLQRQHS